MLVVVYLVSFSHKEREVQAFKMSLVPEKVSKVLSCEIRAQAKKKERERRHVSHFKFIKTTFVLLTYLFPFSRKAYNLSAPPSPPHTIRRGSRAQRSTLDGEDATYTSNTAKKHTRSFEIHE